MSFNVVLPYLMTMGPEERYTFDFLCFAERMVRILLLLMLLRFARFAVALPVIAT